MSTNPVNGTDWWKNPNDYGNNRKTGNEMDADSFLQLLATELKYQDPMNPTSNTEFVAQMAQFNSLQRMEEMSKSMDSVKAYGLIGKVVSYMTTDESGKQVIEFGTVQTAFTQAGEAYVTVNGKEINLKNVVEVGDSPSKPIGELAKLVGMNCKGYLVDRETGDSVSVRGLVKSVRKDAGQDYAVMDDVEVEIDSIKSSDYSSSEDKYQYLQDHIGKEVTVTIKDPATGKTTTVKGTVESVTNTDGKIQAVLDGVDVSANLIYSAS